MAEWRQLLTQKRQDELKAKCWNQLTSSDLRPGDGLLLFLTRRRRERPGRTPRSHCLWHSRGPQMSVTQPWECLQFLVTDVFETNRAVPFSMLHLKLESRSRLSEALPSIRSQRRYEKIRAKSKFVNVL